MGVLLCLERRAHGCRNSLLSLLICRKEVVRELRGAELQSRLPISEWKNTDKPPRGMRGFVTQRLTGIQWTQERRHAFNKTHERRLVTPSLNSDGDGPPSLENVCVKTLSED